MKKLCFIAPSDLESQIIRTCLNCYTFDVRMRSYGISSDGVSCFNTLSTMDGIIPIGIFNLYSTKKSIAQERKDIKSCLCHYRDIFCFDNCLSALFPSELRDDEYCFRDDKRDDIIAYLKEHFDDFKKNEVIVEIQDYINELIKRYNEEE